jgi:hypothetical protein
MHFVLYCIVQHQISVSHKFKLDCCRLVSLRYIRGVTAIMLPSSVVVCGVKHLSGQTKDYNIAIGVYCFSVKHAVLRSKSKDGFSQNQVHVVCICGQVKRLLFQSVGTINI